MKLKCINDKGRPKQIPLLKWICEGVYYTPIRIALALNMNNILVVELAEIFLDESNAPYEFFRLDRFSFRLEDLQELESLIAMTDERQEISELLKEQFVEID